MSLTPITDAPSRGSAPDVFAVKADTLLGVSIPRMITEINVLLPTIDSAAVSAADAAASAAAAAAASAATVWVSGTTYTAGNVRWSPTNFQSYRRKTNGAGTTDPSLDPTYWAQITSMPVMTGNAGKVLQTDGTSAAWVPNAAATIFNKLNFGGF